MPFETSEKVAKPAPVGVPKIVRGVPLPPLGQPSLAAQRAAFYTSVNVGDSFEAPDFAYANHIMAWGRKNGRQFAKRTANGTTRVWRIA